ncbi:unnamed protein product [Protopolystoma xenopodis]|uniref:Uncharacterized protein n=1 Tax=Protopolystoma xenopodis TaxID=117903 RepID=A0A3S5AHH1_9PLAT|nr:unnamed protein product [Protopolystoma xenopodis]
MRTVQLSSPYPSDAPVVPEIQKGEGKSGVQRPWQKRISLCIQVIRCPNALGRHEPRREMGEVDEEEAACQGQGEETCGRS